MKKIIMIGTIFALLLTASSGVAQMNTGHGGGMMDGGEWAMDGVLGSLSRFS